MDRLLAAAVESLDVVVAPEILHGWFPAFREFPGTQIEDPDVFVRYALAVGRSLARHGAKRIVFLNTGVTQSTGLPLGLAVRELHAQQHIPVLLVSWDDLESPELKRLLQQRAGTHADELETSLMLYLRLTSFIWSGRSRIIAKTVQGKGRVIDPVIFRGAATIRTVRAAFTVIRHWQRPRRGGARLRS